MIITRRHALTLAASFGALTVAPHMLLARVPSDRRFVFVIQRGAADGLNIVVPTADPAYAVLRGPLAIEPASAIKLDGSFALHPAMVETGKLFALKQAAFVHAIASPYRERSHFDGQNVLESGGAQPYAIKDGWLNRLVTLMPRSAADPVALAPTVPLALRGPAPVTSYAPSNLPQATDDLLARVTRLYAGDTQLHTLWSAAMEARGVADANEPGRDPTSVGKLAASFLSRPDGARIAMIETGGWDTHSGQNGRLAASLKGLDAMIAGLRDGMGTAWQDTVVLVATEFGRTAAANGTGGTDHGTASVAMLMGGAVAGGRVVADWPGLSASALYEGRDLKATTSLWSLFAGVAADCFGLNPDRVTDALYSDNGRTSALSELVYRV